MDVPFENRKSSGETMPLILILWIIVPVAIYLGLAVFHNVVLTFIVFYGIICLLIPIVDLLFLQKKSILEYLGCLGFRDFKKNLIPSALIGTIFGASLFLFFVLMEKNVIQIERMRLVLNSWNINNKYIIPLLLTMIFANSLFEEVYWRGYIFHKLEKRVSPGKVIVLSSLFYASYHLITTINLFSIFYGLIFTGIIFGVGFFWGVMRKKNNSIYFSVISHLLADLGIMLIYIRYFY
jgi:membrane protease YdiL (CAAX protease family)